MDRSSLVRILISLAFVYEDLVLFYFIRMQKYGSHKLNKSKNKMNFDYQTDKEITVFATNSQLKIGNAYVLINYLVC